MSDTKPSQPSQYWGLLRRRSCLAPTLRGWWLLFVLLLVPLVLVFWNVESFLAVNDPAPDAVFVVEGWSPDYALAIAKSKAEENSTHKLYVTGGPLEEGAPLSEYKTFAELGAATLLRMGMSKDSVQAVPASYVRRDRTYASAMALRDWFSRHGGLPKAINLISVGPHARRSRLMYEMAFGTETRVGIIAVQDQSYDPAHWWKSSAGVRSVLDESIAYIYARFVFSPSREESP